MRNRRLSVRQTLGFVVVAAGLVAGANAVQDDPTPQMGAYAQASATSPSWEARMLEHLRRLFIEMGGNPADFDGAPLKTAGAMVSLRFTLFGLPPDLTAGQLAEIEQISAEVAACATWEPGPPEGTSYDLIVFLHDLGKAINGAAVVY
jgi:hypothetical protein